MKNVILLHGSDGSDTDYFWFADTKQFLESKGYTVWWPLLPNTNDPNLAETKDFVNSNMPAIDEETIIIGHSSACPLILDMLPEFKTKISKVILVAGYYKPLPSGSSNMLPISFDYKNIKAHANEIILINSDNDPWGCDDKQARPVAENLKAKFILAKNQGHMGSVSFNQPFHEFSLLKSLL
jgi:uncharacterized protein